MKASLSREVDKALGVWSGNGHGPEVKKAKGFTPIQVTFRFSVSPHFHTSKLILWDYRLYHNIVQLCLLNPGTIAKFTKKTSADMSGHRTPWSNSSLPSDRIKPSPPPTRPSSAAKNKGKGKEPQQQPRSAAVRSLEVLIRKLKTQSGTEKDPEDGCFCQGACVILFPSIRHL